MELMSSSISTHLFFIYILLAIMLINIYSVYTVKDFVTLAKRLRFFTPMFHTLNAIVIYTGTIVAFYAKTFSFTIFIMIAAAIAIMVLEIKRYKKMRIIKVADKQLQSEFVVFAKKIYTTQIAILIITYILSKLF